MSHEPKAPLGFLNDQTGDLGHLLSKAKTLAAVQAAFYRLLDPALAKHCQVANTDNLTLTLMVNSGTTATQLRFLITDLLQQFAKTPLLAPYQTINIKVRPPLAPSQKRQSTADIRRKAQPISSESKSQIQEAAKGIQHQGLKAALLRLSKQDKKQDK